MLEARQASEDMAPDAGDLVDLGHLLLQLQVGGGGGRLLRHPCGLASTRNMQNAVREQARGWMEAIAASTAR
jgi:hypothetical protein